MRIEEGKTYVDENGKKAGPLIGGSFKYIVGRGGADDPEWENDGTVRIEGEEGYGNLVAQWFLDTPNGPIRTETVTVRRLEPGVYGRLSVRDNLDPKRVNVGLTNIGGTRMQDTALNASELRVVARVATELAEFLDAQ